MGCGQKLTNYNPNINCENRPDNFDDCVAGPYIPQQSLREDQIDNTVYNCALINDECNRDVYDNSVDCETITQQFIDKDGGLKVNGKIIFEFEEPGIPTMSPSPSSPTMSPSPSSPTMSPSPTHGHTPENSPVTTPSSSSSGLSGGAIAGIVIGSILLLISIILLIYFLKYKKSI